MKWNIKLKNVTSLMSVEECQSVGGRWCQSWAATTTAMQTYALNVIKICRKLNNVQNIHSRWNEWTSELSYSKWHFIIYLFWSHSTTSGLKIQICTILDHKWRITFLRFVLYLDWWFFLAAGKFDHDQTFHNWIVRRISSRKSSYYLEHKENL